MLNKHESRLNNFQSKNHYIHMYYLSILFYILKKKIFSRANSIHKMLYHCDLLLKSLVIMSSLEENEIKQNIKGKYTIILSRVFNDFKTELKKKN